MKKYIKCYDKFNQQLFEGDYVDVQKDGVHQIYKKEDGQLYFKPYGKEDMVCAYFSNDIAKCDEVGNWLNNDRYEDIEEDVVKPETLEEAAKVIYPDYGYKDELYCDIGQLFRDLFIEGAKWQQERMYSEEEVLKLVDGAFHMYASSHRHDAREWLVEQFKNK